MLFKPLPFNTFIINLIVSALWPTSKTRSHLTHWREWREVKLTTNERKKVGFIYSKLNFNMLIVTEAFGKVEVLKIRDARACNPPRYDEVSVAALYEYCLKMPDMD